MKVFYAGLVILLLGQCYLSEAQNNECGVAENTFGMVCDGCRAVSVCVPFSDTVMQLSCREPQFCDPDAPPPKCGDKVPAGCEYLTTTLPPETPATVVTQSGPDTPESDSQTPTGTPQPPADVPGTQPPTDEPGTQPPTEEPATQPPTQEPTEEPGTQPPTDEPGTQPPTEEPSTQPPTQEPSTQPPTEEPSTQPPTQEPSTQPPTQEPSTQLPTEEPITQPPTEAPTTQPPTQEPSTQPSTEQPTTQPPTQEPSTQEPSTAQPSTVAPTTLEPTTLQPTTSTAPPAVTAAPGAILCTEAGIYPDPFDCKKYQYCPGKGLSSSIQRCPPNYVFDQSWAGGIGFPCRISINNPFDCAKVDCSGSSTFKRYGSSKKYYATCDVNSTTGETKVSIYKCVDGESFNGTRCAYTCPREGLWANVADPRKYYQCYWSGNQLIYRERSCPPNKVFNDTIKVCLTQTV